MAAFCVYSVAYAQCKLAPGSAWTCENSPTGTRTVSIVGWQCVWIMFGSCDLFEV